MMIKRTTHLTVLLMCVFIAMKVSVAQESGAKKAEIFATHKKTLAFIKNGQIQDALSSAEHAYTLAQTVLEQDDPSLTPLEMSYSNLLMATASHARAKEVLTGTLARVENVHGRTSIEALPVLVSISEVLRGKEQVIAVIRALAIHKEHHPEKTLEYANYAVKTGSVLATERGIRALAIPILEEALQIYEKNYGKNSEELIPVLMALGDANARFRKVTLQRKLYDRAIKIANRSADKHQHATLMYTAGMHLMQLSSAPQARRYLKNAFDEFLALSGPDNFETAKAQLGLARFDVAADKHRRAEQNLLSALNVFEQDANFRDYQLTTLSLLVQTYETMGERDAATPYCQAIGKVTPWHSNQDYRPLFKPIPDYPVDAKRLRREGYIVVQYTVDADGFVRSPEVVQTDLPKSFYKATLAAVDGFRYAPRYRDGQPVAVPKVTNKFTFKVN